MRPIIVGEAPSKNQDPERPIEGRIGKRLALFANLSYEAYLEHFERVNLLHLRQDDGTKFIFDNVAAAEEAKRLRQAWDYGRQVLLLGNRVAKAFGVQGPCFERLVYDHDFYIVPHPSGLNRFYNDPANRHQARAFLSQFVRATL